MAPNLPEGDTPPVDGALPASAGVAADTRDFGVYLHVPFCSVRCGYCDFNTYTQADMPGVSHQQFPNLVIDELRLASRALDFSRVPPRPAATVFFGGGTPTLLEPSEIGRMLDHVRQEWGLTDGAEVTVEANPDTLDARRVNALAEVGVTRLSLGVQSFVPHVLATLERTHSPEMIAPAVRWAQQAGLQVSVDLIYGTPGESATDWQHSLSRALELQPDHVSAYSLIVEPGTALARQIRRGELETIDDDTQAEFYDLADEALLAAGYQWYEVSNWARSASSVSRHNLGYWRSQDWWGIGPGAHSHIGGLRWWNVKHPAAWAQRIRGGLSPAFSREQPDDDARRLERIMLGLRLREGIGRHELPDVAATIDEAVDLGWLDREAYRRGRVVLTRLGRLMADGLALRLASP